MKLYLEEQYQNTFQRLRLHAVFKHFRKVHGKQVSNISKNNKSYFILRTLNVSYSGKTVNALCSKDERSCGRWTAFSSKLYLQRGQLYEKLTQMHYSINEMINSENLHGYQTEVPTTVCIELANTLLASWKFRKKMLDCFLLPSTSRTSLGFYACILLLIVLLH